MTRPHFRKVLCYLTDGSRLLLFRHRDVPDAGLQIPAGTVLAGEEPAAAALRETMEETGIQHLELIAPLGVYVYRFDYPPRLEDHERHGFLLRTVGLVPNEWSHFAEGRHWFDFFWVALDSVPQLEAEQDAFLSQARRTLVLGQPR